jgi:hypothetical protein
MSVLVSAIAEFLEVVEFGKVVSAPGKLGIRENFHSRQSLNYPFVSGLLEIWPGEWVVGHFYMTRSSRDERSTELKSWLGLEI